jgi:hypothetical protein
LAIRPKKTISNMLVLIPVNNENKWLVNYLYTFFPFPQWTQRRTFMIHELFSQSFYWLKTDVSLDIVFKPGQIFFASSCAKFHFQISGWI